MHNFIPADVFSLPSLGEIQSIAEDIVHSLPKRFRKMIRQIFIRVDNFPDILTLKNLKIDNKYDLLGLYKGIPIPSRKDENFSISADFIYLYRCPLVRYTMDHQNHFNDLIRHVILNEIGYHIKSLGSNPIIL